MQECSDGKNQFTYDRQGGIVEEKNAMGIRLFSYNSRHQQTKVETESGNVQENRYDVENLRFELLENGKHTDFVYHNGELLHKEGGEEKQTSYHLGAGIDAFQRGQELYYYQQDEQLSTAFITGEHGEIQNSYLYDAFGTEVETNEQFPNRICYTGQQYDDLTGQYYLRARYYNPILGRFMQEDVYQGDGLNLYAYCGNNPVTYNDPSGYAAKLQLDGCPPNGNVNDSSQTEEPNRSEALNQIRDDLDIPRSQQPIKQEMVILRDEYGNPVIYDGNIVMAREMQYEVHGKLDGAGNPIDYVVIQEHSYGHYYESRIGNQPSHFNIRPNTNVNIGSVQGTQDHYYYNTPYNWHNE